MREHGQKFCLAHGCRFGGRLHILRTKGIDPAAMFIARHSNLLEQRSS